MKRTWEPTHTEQVVADLEFNVYEYIGALKISKIDTGDCLNILEQIESREAYSVCSKIKQRMTCIFNEAIILRMLDRNPMEPLKGFGTKYKTKHYKAIKCEDLPNFLNCLETTLRMSEVTKLCLKMVTLTFVRSWELRGAKWQEFDLENKVWLIPGQRMKMNLPHIVPLSEQALQVLCQLKEINGSREYVFASPKNRSLPLSSSTLNSAIRRIGFDATTHGFRSIASTVLNEKNFKEKAIERQLSHVEHNKVAGTYNKAQYLKKRIKFMQWWANYLEGIQMGTRKPINYVIQETS